MPQAKNKARRKWAVPENVKLRRGQIEALECIEQNPQQNEFVFVLPTGYGKSFVSLMSYAKAREQGRCDRLLIVVPTGIQKDQYVKGLLRDSAALDIDLIGGSYPVRECDGEGFVIKASLRNECEVFVATVQSLNPKNIGFYHDLMSKGNWMLIADEAHRYSDDNTWGQAVKSLPAGIKIGLTATPCRSDRKDLIVGGSKEYDVCVTVKEAVKEGALRPFYLEKADYEVDLTTEGETKTYTLSELREEWDSQKYKSISEWEIKRQCRYSSKYIQGIFLEAMTAYTRMELAYPSKNQIIVFAWSCEHAKSISNQINVVAGDPMFSDWIGSSGKSDEDNKEVLDRFMAEDNFLPCLVQVNKASEGFNNPRCSIAIFLDNIENVKSPSLMQKMGRVMRTCTLGSPYSVIFVGKDHLLSGLDLEEFGAISDDPETGAPENPYLCDPEDGNRYNIKIPSLSEVFVSVKRLLGFDSENPFEEKAKEIAKGLIKTQEEYKDWDEESLFQAILKLEGRLKEEVAPSHNTYSEQRDLIRKQVQRAVESLVNDAISQTLYPQKITQSIKKDWYCKTNGHFAKKFGKTETLDIEDLKRKYQYVKEVAEEINETQEVPRWMIP